MSPREEITVALQSTHGVDSVSDHEFLRAWRAVVSSAEAASLYNYVFAAISLRPGLGPQIVQNTLSVLIPPQKRLLTRRDKWIVRETVRAAFEIDQALAGPIVEVSLCVQPFARPEILEAALSLVPGQRQAISQAADHASPGGCSALLIFGRTDAPASVGLLNSWNIDARAGSDDSVRSPEKPPEIPTQS